MPNPSIKVIELFAGVGGFRLALEGWKGNSCCSKYKTKLSNKIPFEVIYSNQWEPSTKLQHANIIYSNRFNTNGHFDQDIHNIKSDMLPIKCNLLVGGFPCPDFSVGSLLKYSKGLAGKKGELWFEIIRLLKELKEKNRKPEYLLFENVDRMLSSPAGQSGKDFSEILHTLDDLNYNVEWKVINAAEYGFPQRRKRVFVFCYCKESNLSSYYSKYSNEELLTDRGVISSAFPSNLPLNSNFQLKLNSKHHGKYKAAGLMINGEITDQNYISDSPNKTRTLNSILYKGSVDEEFYLNDQDINKWKIAKGAKSILREKNGHQYLWSEGAIPFPDVLDKPSRTIITSEGGMSVSRTRHVILDKNGRYRRLIPIELERLNMFPDDFTKHESITNNKRAFLMGNALVVGIIERIGTNLSNIINNLSKSAKFE